MNAKTIEEKVNNIADYIIAHRNNPEAIAEAVENLSKALALAIALGSKGDAKKMDELMMGVEGYISMHIAVFSEIAGSTLKL